jgi:predicted nucleotidyltransferase
MNFGLNEHEYQFISNNFVIPFQRRGAVIWCFGSRARGDHHQHSDVDLLVSGPESLRVELGNYREIFEKSNFPYKVDIVFESDVAQSYRASILQERRLFLDQSPRL